MGKGKNTENTEEHTRLNPIERHRKEEGGGKLVENANDDACNCVRTGEKTMKVELTVKISS